MMLQQRYPHLLPTLAIQGYLHSLPSNINLLAALDLVMIGPIDLVICGSSCQGLSQVSMDQRLPILGHVYFRNWFVLCNICSKHMHPCAYLLENVPPLRDYKPIVLARWQQIKAWIGKPVQVDVVSVGSWAHWFWWMWTNLASLEVIQQAYEFIPRSPTCLVGDILDLTCHSWMAHHDDRPPLVVVNRVGFSWTTLPTFVSFPHSHAFKNGYLGMIWDSHSLNMEEPNAHEGEWAMGFHISTTFVQGISKGIYRQIWGNL